MTKMQMIDEVMSARKRGMNANEIYDAILYAIVKPLDYVKKVYDLFLTDKEHVEFYYALLVR